MNTSNQPVENQDDAVDVREICRAIERIPCKRGRFNATEAFSTFVQHALASLVVAHKRRGQPFFKVDANFIHLGFTLIDPSVPQSAYTEIGEASSAYLRAVVSNEPFTDLLTPIHAHFLGKCGGDGLGQFFTPWDLSKLCSALAVDHARRHGSGSFDRISINDPTCGAGGLILAQVQGRRSMADDATAFINKAALCCAVSGNDIDPLCSAMTSLQLMASQFIHGPLGAVNIEVGNTLTAQKATAFQTMSRYIVVGDQVHQIEPETPWDAQERAMEKLAQFWRTKAA